MAKKIMVQGAGWTGIGKSFTVALLCRLFSEDGNDVAPFKTLNLTSVTYRSNGKEFGYSQALQAVSAGQKPDYRMNPLNLKPSDGKIDINLEGKCIERGYDFVGSLAKGKLIQQIKEFRKKVEEAADRNLRSLSKECDIVCIEGAGPAKTPIMEFGFLDLANMETAYLANSPVLLLTNNLDSIHGILSYMRKEERERVKGIIWNKVRIDEISKLGVERDKIKLALRWVKLAYRKVIKPEIVATLPYFKKLAKLPEPDPIIPSPKIPFQKWKKVTAACAKEAREFINLERIYEFIGL